MRGMSAIEASLIAKELDCLEEMHLDKFYENGPGEFTLRFSRKGDVRSVSCYLPYCMNITEYSERHEEPTNFATAVRKRVSGLVLQKAVQLGGDRIIELWLQKAETTIGMIFEFFGKGNLILVDQSMKILLSYSQKDFRERSTKFGRPYQRPQGQQVTIEDLSNVAGAIGASAAEHSGEGIASVLAKTVNPGTLYLENALAEAGINPKDKAGSVPTEQIEKLAERISGYLKTVPDPRIYYDAAGNALDYAMCDIKKYAALQKRHFETMSAVFDEFYHPPKEVQVPEKLRSQMAETTASIEKQKNAALGARREAEECKIAAAQIYLKLNELNEFIYKASKIKKPTVEELNSLVAGIGVLSFDAKEKSVEIEMQV
jgi:predicted ribosome quality control (RQC) complex YloA/Tae2 family protein